MRQITFRPSFRPASALLRAVAALGVAAGGLGFAGVARAELQAVPRATPSLSTSTVSVTPPVSAPKPQTPSNTGDSRSRAHRACDPPGTFCGDPAADGPHPAGDGAAGDSAAGHSAAGHRAAGHRAAGDDAAGHRAAGDDAAGDDAAGDDARARRHSCACAAGRTTGAAAGGADDDTCSDGRRANRDHHLEDHDLEDHGRERQRRNGHTLAVAEHPVQHGDAAALERAGGNSGEGGAPRDADIHSRDRGGTTAPKPTGFPAPSSAGAPASAPHTRLQNLQLACTTRTRPGQLTARRIGQRRSRSPPRTRDSERPRRRLFPSIRHSGTCVRPCRTRRRRHRRRAPRAAAPRRADRRASRLQASSRSPLHCCWLRSLRRHACASLRPSAGRSVFSPRSNDPASSALRADLAPRGSERGPPPSARRRRGLTRQLEHVQANRWRN